jgi:3-oxoacyl-(acyl-carrier-protein) synthase
MAVFAGVSQLEYARLTLEAAVDVNAFYATGAHLSVSSGRISYTYGLRGPAITVDTACSSSLVTAHLAARALRAGEAAAAASLGVNLTLAPSWTLACQRAGMLADDGRCKTLDAAADGYVRAEGAACIILIRADAVSAEALDRLGRSGALVALAGTAVNQDGRSSSLTAPNGPAQQAAIRAALAAGGGSDGGLSPLSISLLEMHGTGTPLGDPIEVGAATAVLAAPNSARPRAQPLRLAALKSHMGHAEPAAGALGLLRLKEQLQGRRACSILQLRSLNPFLGGSLMAAAGGVAIPRQSAPLPACAAGTLAGGVSAFAFMGTNAHALLSSELSMPPLPAGHGGAAAGAGFSALLRRSRLYVLPRRHPLASALAVAEGAVTFVCRVDGPRLAYLRQHVVLGRALLPAAAMLELALAAAHSLAGDDATSAGGRLAIASLAIASPIILPDASAAAAAAGEGTEGELLVTCRLSTDGGVTIGALRPGASEEGAPCASGRVALLRDAAATAAPPPALPAFLRRLARSRAAAAAESGGSAGTPLSTEAAAIGRIAPEMASEWQLAADYLTPPQRLDAALHLGVVQTSAGARIPVAVGLYAASPDASADEAGEALPARAGRGGRDFQLLRPAGGGAPASELRGLETRAGTPAGGKARAAPAAPLCYETAWQVEAVEEAARMPRFSRARGVDLEAWSPEEGAPVRLALSPALSPAAAVAAGLAGLQELGAARGLRLRAALPGAPEVGAGAASAGVDAADALRGLLRTAASEMVDARVLAISGGVLRSLPPPPPAAVGGAIRSACVAGGCVSVPLATLCRTPSLSA